MKRVFVGSLPLVFMTICQATCASEPSDVAGGGSRSQAPAQFPLPSSTGLPSVTAEISASTSPLRSQMSIEAKVLVLSADGTENDLPAITRGLD